MMTRRSFVKRLSVALAGIAVGAELLSDSLTAKAVRGIQRINPAWVAAPYEVGFLFNPEVFNRLNPWGQEYAPIELPINMPNERDESVPPIRGDYVNGKFVEIPRLTYST